MLACFKKLSSWQRGVPVAGFAGSAAVQCLWPVLQVPQLCSECASGLQEWGNHARRPGVAGGRGGGERPQVADNESAWGARAPRGWTFSAKSLVGRWKQSKPKLLSAAVLPFLPFYQGEDDGRWGRKRRAKDLPVSPWGRAFVLTEGDGFPIAHPKVLPSPVFA